MTEHANEAHPAVGLWQAHRAVAPYPEGVKPVPEPIEGNAFFPGGLGLWKERPTDPIPQWPRHEVMVLGHDFHSEEGYHASLERGEESPKQPTWANLLALFERAGLDKRSCFFTNVYMGLRAGKKTTGPFPGRHDADFVGRCRAFLRLQLETQAPRLIVVLGRAAVAFLGETLPELADWATARSFKELDLLGALRTEVALGPGATAAVVPIIHPSLRWASVRVRRYSDMSGDDAEVRLLQDAIRTVGSL